MRLVYQQAMFLLSGEYSGSKSNGFRLKYSCKSSPDNELLSLEKYIKYKYSKVK